MGPLGAGVVLGGADRHDPVAVAVGRLEDGAGAMSAQDLTAPEPVQL